MQKWFDPDWGNEFRPRLEREVAELLPVSAWRTLAELKADAADAIIGELTLFWQYLDRVYELPKANAIVQCLRTDGLVNTLKAKMSDSSNFGTSKSLVMMGDAASFDMNSQEGMNKFMAAFNLGLVGNGNTPFETVENYRVGRNDRCNCGSGNKFKKCCVRR